MDNESTEKTISAYIKSQDIESMLRLLKFSKYELKEKLINNKEFMLTLAKEKPLLVFQNLSDKLKQNKKFMLELSMTDPYFFINHVSDEIRNELIKNKNFMLKLAQDHLKFAIEKASDELKNNKEFMLNLATRDPMIVFETASEQLKSNPEFITVLLKMNPYLFINRVGDEIRNEIIKNKEIMLKLAQDHLKFSMKIMSDELKKDKDFIYQIVMKDPIFVFKNVDEEIKSILVNNKEFILKAACYNSKFAIEHVGDELKKDKEFMLKLIRIEPYLDPNKLDASKDVLFMIEIFSKYPLKSLGDIAPALEKDRKFLLHLISMYPEEASEYLSDNLKNDKYFMLMVSRSSPIFAMKYASAEVRDELKKDQYFLMKIVSLNPIVALEFASDKLKNNKKIMLEIADSYPKEAYEKASTELRKDKDLMLLVLKKQPEQVISYVQNEPEAKQALEELIVNFNKFKLIETWNIEIHKDIYSIVFQVTAKKFNSNLINKLYKIYGQSYEEKITKNDSSKGNIVDFIRAMIDSNVLENIYKSNLYNINDIKFLESILSFYEVRFVKITEDRIKKYVEQYRLINLNLYNNFIVSKDNKEELKKLLDKYKITEINAFEFVKSNKYWSALQKRTLIEIFSSYFNINIIRVIDILKILEEMERRNLNLTEILEEKEIDRGTFLRIYNESKESNPLLYELISENLKNSQKRGYFKLIKLGYKILDTDIKSVEEYNSKFNISIERVLGSLSNTELYAPLYDKLSPFIENQGNKYVKVLKP